MEVIGTYGNWSGIPKCWCSGIPGLVNVYSLRTWKWPSRNSWWLPMKNADFPVRYVSSFTRPARGKTWRMSIEGSKIFKVFLRDCRVFLEILEIGDPAMFGDLDVGQNGRPLRGPQMWMSSLVLTIQLNGFLILTHTHLLKLFPNVKRNDPTCLWHSQG